VSKNPLVSLASYFPLSLTLSNFLASCFLFGESKFLFTRQFADCLEKLIHTPGSVSYFSDFYSAEKKE
jgi:hypothetical protein